MIVAIILVLILSLFVIFLINFYRNPNRAIPYGENIVSPADGRVICIMRTCDDSVKIRKGLLGKIRTLAGDVADDCHVVSIFMSPLDVHYNRAPIEGVVKSINYKKGKFFKAYDFEKSLENEKNEITIQSLKNKKLKVKTIQIAGFLARRIKCFVRANQKLNKGDRIGMIALSSQATLIFPAWAKLKISVGERVMAGESIIAEL